MPHAALAAGDSADTAGRFAATNNGGAAPRNRAETAGGVGGGASTVLLPPSLPPIRGTNLPLTPPDEVALQPFITTPSPPPRRLPLQSRASPQSGWQPLTRPQRLPLAPPSRRPPTITEAGAQPRRRRHNQRTSHTLFNLSSACTPNPKPVLPAIPFAPRSRTSPPARATLPPGGGCRRSNSEAAVCCMLVGWLVGCKLCPQHEFGKRGYEAHNVAATGGDGLSAMNGTVAGGGRRCQKCSMKLIAVLKHSTQGDADALGEMLVQLGPTRQARARALCHEGVGRIAIAIAVQTGDVDCVQILCEAGAQLLPLDEQPPSPSLVTHEDEFENLWHTELEEAKALIWFSERGEWHTPIQTALATEQLEIIKILLAHGGSEVLNYHGYRRSPLGLLIVKMSGPRDPQKKVLLRIFLDHGADIHVDYAEYYGFNAPQLAVHNRSSEALELLLEHDAAWVINPKNYLLHIAASYNNVKAIQLLLDAGVAADAVSGCTIFPSTALICAVKKDARDAAALLIERGADVNGTGLTDNAASRSAGALQGDGVSGMTPLLLAATFGFHEMVELLVGHGALVNQRWTASPTSTTPLMHASCLGHQHTVELLLGFGAEPDLVDSADDNALIMAYSAGHPRTVQTLLAYNANPTCDASPEKACTLLQHISVRRAQLMSSDAPAETLKNRQQNCKSSIEQAILGIQMAGPDNKPWLGLRALARAREQGCSTCAICMEDLINTSAVAEKLATGKFLSPRPIALLPCGHSFHSYCSSKWLRSGIQSVCAVCRSTVQANDLKHFTPRVWQEAIGAPRHSMDSPPPSRAPAIPPPLIRRRQGANRTND